MATKSNGICICDRCGHGPWLPRKQTKGLPRICPSCKSKYWNGGPSDKQAQPADQDRKIK